MENQLVRNGGQRLERLEGKEKIRDDTMAYTMFYKELWSRSENLDYQCLRSRRKERSKVKDWERYLRLEENKSNNNETKGIKLQEASGDQWYKTLSLIKLRYILRRS